MRKLIRWLKRDGEPGELLETVYVSYDTCTVTFCRPRWRIEPVLAWYDLWVGIFVDREKRRIYVLPLPCIGFRVYWG